MNKWFEVVVSIEKVYTVEAESVEEAEQLVWDRNCAFAFEIQSQELETDEEVTLSKQNSDAILWA